MVIFIDLCYKLSSAIQVHGRKNCKSLYLLQKCFLSRVEKCGKSWFILSCCRGITGGWTGWAIAHPGFSRIERAAGQWRRAALLLAHPVLGSYLRPSVITLG
jgi:hypothetical protein